MRSLIAKYYLHVYDLPSVDTYLNKRCIHKGMATVFFANVAMTYIQYRYDHKITRHEGAFVHVSYIEIPLPKMKFTTNWHYFSLAYYVQNTLYKDIIKIIFLIHYTNLIEMHCSLS